jgi:hypothetical protein
MIPAIYCPSFDLVLHWILLQLLLLFGLTTKDKQIKKTKQNRQEGGLEPNYCISGTRYLPWNPLDRNNGTNTPITLPSSLWHTGTLYCINGTLYLQWNHLTTTLEPMATSKSALIYFNTNILTSSSSFLMDKPTPLDLFHINHLIITR